MLLSNGTCLDSTALDVRISLKIIRFEKVYCESRIKWRLGNQCTANYSYFNVSLCIESDFFDN